MKQTQAGTAAREERKTMGSGRVRNVLITGGAGFIGSNLAERLLSQPGTHVRIFDNLARSGVTHNLDWLHSLPGQARLEFVRGDVRNASAIAEAARDVTEIYHLAAQVAVTTSVTDPRSDFAINALGTLNVLEAARRSGRRPFLLFTSTNKVYGSLESVPVTIEDTRYRAVDPSFHGVTEAQLLDFHSPYGCSKGSADQYVRDYARIYDLPSVVFRMSCIAGPRQFGNEDQGWVAHFLYSVLESKPITVYGNGFQVRDVLHVSDLIDAMQAAAENISRTSGQVFNVGGGPDRAVSVLEMLRAIEQETGIQPDLRYNEVRPGDQPLYISNISKLSLSTSWQPRLSLVQTLHSIRKFWEENRQLVSGQRAPHAAADLVAEEVA